MRMSAPDIEQHAGAIRISQETLSALAGVSGIAVVVRDEDLVCRWCDAGFEKLCESDQSQLIGSTLRDILPEPAAAEREGLLREVVETGNPLTFVQFGADKRLLCRVLPIDESSFGYAGVLCIVREGDLSDTESDAGPIRVVRTAKLHKLSVLTKSELRTLYDLACGASNQDTADRQFRSVRTIENHVESIHKKMGTTTRSALVRLATECGLHRFTAEEWDGVVDGATLTRRAANAAARRRKTDS